jgi:hypothetical protein
MFEGTRAIDWIMLVIKALVLFLIAYEVIIGIIHRRQESKQRGLHERIMTLARPINQGRQLKKTPPQSSAGVAALASWTKSVHDWSKDAEAFLNACSSHASAKFLDETGMKRTLYMNVTQVVVTFYALLVRAEIE